LSEIQIQLLFEEAMFKGFEKQAIRYCRWLLEMNDEERKVHHESLARIAHAVRTAHGQFWDITPECDCLMCVQWHSAAVSEMWNQARAEDSAREKERGAVRTLEPTFIYLVLDERNGYVKIGRAKDPSARERTLQSEIPCVSMIYRGPANARLEKELHQEYAEFRVRGEWFKLSKTQIDVIIKRVTGTA
jgi:hypothetical protein